MFPGGMVGATPGGLTGLLDPGPRPLGRRGALLLYAGFLGGVLLVTWPLALSPATLWPPHYDARVFTWVMVSMARRLLSHPLALFDGNAFYPFGESLAFTEVLLPPSLLGLPGFLWGNPILTYNLLLLALWPLNGLAMAWVAHGLTGSRPAAWLAGLVFCLSPYFTGYYLEFQMLLAALLPVVLLAWVRWLETQEVRWLGVALAGLTLQGLTTWYYTVILGLGLVVLGAGFVCLRWRGWHWRRQIVALACGGLGVGALLLPVALPYIVVHRELGFERGLGETAGHSADVFTFIEAGGRSLLYRYNPLPLSGGIAETSAFAGVTVLALAAASLGWLGRDAPMPAGLARLSRASRVVLGVTLAALAAIMAFPRGRFWLGPLSVRPRMGGLLDLAVIIGLGLLLLRGWATARRGAGRALSRGDWVRLLLLLTGVFAILALGPVVHVGRRAVGHGPYLGLYHVLFPLHVVRVTSRFAVLSLAGLALLAALGLARLEARLSDRPRARRLVITGVFLAVALEYAVAPAEYERVSAAPRPVDAVLRADPEDVAVLEWPINRVNADADAMVRSLWHGKRLVNGLSGFVPRFSRELAELLTRPGSPFPTPEAQAALRRIYPLRYLVVRLADPDLPEDWRRVWRGLRGAAPPLLRFRGTFGNDDVYEIAPLPERGQTLDRWVSYEVVHASPLLRVALRPLAGRPDLDQWVDVLLNGRQVDRISLSRDVTATVTLPPPFFRAAPNVIRFRWGYRPPASRGEPYRIGTTGAVSPGDFRVRSSGQPYGSASSIQLDGVELAPDRRGYNLVAVTPDGRVARQEGFDTFRSREAAERLAAWVEALPAGTIVAGAVRDEGSGQLTAGAVAALGTLGVAGDLRGHFRESHAFVGVKGAPAGSALEALGPRPVEVVVGRPLGDGFEMTDFTLAPGGAGAAPPGAR
ncbi:MAG: hypothetical protein HY002_09365 [Candidatus Rokubacteria bacterium]|nr:hypothetical protein [Candidatus Rokubacteria bacterium]